MDPQLRHCVGGKLLDKHGTVEPSRVTCPRDTTSVLEGRERSQPYLTRTSSRVDLYTTDLTLASEQHGLSPSRLTQHDVRDWPCSRLGARLASEAAARRLAR